MTIQIKESDWKLLNKLRTDALERFCQRILAEIDSINANKSLSAHQRYLEINQIIGRRER